MAEGTDSGYNTPKNDQYSDEDIQLNHSQTISHSSKNMNKSAQPKREVSFSENREEIRSQNRTIKYESPSTSSTQKSTKNKTVTSASGMAGSSKSNVQRPVTTIETKSDSHNPKTSGGSRSKSKSLSSSSGGVGSRNRVSSAPSNSTKKNNDSSHFDLIANPDMLLEQLGDMDLTEDELDYLLNDAYALNKKLKEELQRQESRSTRAESSPNYSRQRSGKPAKLPPLSASKTRHEKQTAIYGTKSTSASYGGSPSRAKKQDSSPPARRSQGAKSQKKTDWDDRFSYS